MLLSRNPWTFTRCLTLPCAYVRSQHAYCPGLLGPGYSQAGVPWPCMPAHNCTVRYKSSSFSPQPQCGLKTSIQNKGDGSPGTPALLGQVFLSRGRFPNAQESLTFKAGFFSTLLFSHLHSFFQTSPFPTFSSPLSSILLAFASLLSLYAAPHP